MATTEYTTAAKLHVPILVRCACLTCGAHVEARVGMATVGGSCPNCGGYDLDCSALGASLAGARS